VFERVSGAGRVTRVRGFGFVGREAELAAIADAAARAESGRAQAVWIEGDAGAGKSALLRAAVERLPSAFTPVRAEADELATEVPLEVVAQLGVRSAADPFEAGLELLARLDALQDDGPVALVVEDLHWADAASRQALLAAARRLSDDRVLLLVTSRPTSAADGWERFASDPERCLLVGLGSLSVPEVAALAAMAGVALVPSDAERLYRHTGGHALYVRTLLTELTPEQLASPDRALPAPRSLASMTVRRLVELPPDARLLGSALAVLNQRAPLDLVARVAGIDESAAALEPLLATGFVTWSPGEVATPIEFTHPLYRTAVYDDLTPTRRRDLHRSAAAVLSGDAATVHRVAGANLGDEELAAELAADARAKAAAGARSIAARDLFWASSISADPSRREHYLLGAAAHLLDDGQTGRVEARRGELEACRPAPLRSLVLGSLARARGDAVASRYFEEVADLVGEDPDGPQILAVASARLAGVCTTLGRGEDAIAAAQRSLALDPEDLEIERYAWASMALGESIVRGGVAGLALLAQRLSDDPTEVEPQDAELLVTRSMLGSMAGRVQQPIADVQFAIRSGHIGTTVHQRPRAHLHLGLLLQESGDLDLAGTHIRTAASLIADERHVWLEAQVHAAQAMLASLRGEWDEAEREVASALAAADLVDTFEAHYAAEFAKSALHRARAEHREMIEVLHGLIGDGDPAGIPMVTSLGWWPPLIHAYLEVGDVAGAEHHIDQLVRAAGERQLDVGARVLGLRARVAAAHGRPDEALAQFSASLASRGPDDPIIDRGITMQAYGQVLHGRGRRREAVDQLRSAHELFADLGAEPFRARVQADLERIGIHAARAEDRSPLALTDREQDVASLVATGMTNKEVAAELYVSSKAVEYHLRNIFGKLGIANRRELRDRLAPR
jgi:ATP/maltotriose-dependent transcriptional regulator MalT